MKIPKNVSIERIHKTEAYDLFEAWCDDDQGGDSDNALAADKYDRQQIINLLYPIIKREVQKQ